MAQLEHIKIQAQAPRVQYIADGVQTLFTYTFPAFEPENLQVYVNEVLQVGTYTASGIGSSHGGAVSFAAPPPSGSASFDHKPGRL